MRAYCVVLGFIVLGLGCLVAQPRGFYVVEAQSMRIVGSDWQGYGVLLPLPYADIRRRWGRFLLEGARISQRRSYWLLRFEVANKAAYLAAISYQATQDTHTQIFIAPASDNILGDSFLKNSQKATPVQLRDVLLRFVLELQKEQWQTQIQDIEKQQSRYGHQVVFLEKRNQKIINYLKRRQKHPKRSTWEKDIRNNKTQISALNKKLAELRATKENTIKKLANMNAK